MAYYLQYDGVNDYVESPSYSLAAGDFVEITITNYTGKDGLYHFITDSFNTTSRMFLGIRTTQNIEIPSNARVFLDGLPILNNQSFTAAMDGNDHVVRINVFSGTLNLGRIGSRLNNIETYPGGIKAVTVSQGGVLTTWDGTTAPSSGSTWTATDGTSQLLLNNFPTDGSQWVPYGGSVPISFAGTIPNININAGDVVNIDLSAYFDGTELPFVFTSIGADLSAVGLSIAANAIVGNATAGSLTGARIRGTDAALNTADSNLFNVEVAAVVVTTESAVNFAWPVPSVSALQATQIDSAVSFTWPAPAISAQQTMQTDTAVNYAWPVPSISVLQQQLNSSEIAFSWHVPSISVQLQQVLQDGALISFTWPTPSISAAQESTVPENNAIINFDWPLPVFTINQVSSNDLPTDAPSVSYKHNKLWAESVFFKQYR